MRIKTFLKRAARHYTTAVLAGLVLCSTLLGGTIYSIDNHLATQEGVFQPGATYNGENYHNDLDLTIAARASFPSSPLKTVQTLRPLGGLPAKVVSFRVTDDNLTEYALMMLPHGAMPAQGWPAIILCHGYTSPAKYSELNTYISDMEFYSRHGFAVIKPDYRGQGRSIHAGQANSGYYSMAYNTDVMSLITSLKETKYIDKANLNLWGHSFGAYIALRAAVLSPDIKNLIMLSGPVDSLTKMYLSYLPPSDENDINALKTRQDVFNKYGPPTEDTIFWHNASPINFISHIKAHLQINVGKLDQTVPPQFSADLDAALTKAHIQHDYYVYSDGQHSLLLQRHLIWSRSLQDLQSASLPAPPA
jgi:dipeptidyl aminopeptidase/acylaminoacyl peptidase